MFMLILRRMRLSLLVIFLAVTALYLMIHMVPGDPVNVMLGPRATPELRQELIERLCLDQPIYKQLFTFYVNIFKGDLGIDIQTGRPVWNLVIGQLPYTLSLVASALFVILEKIRVTS